MQLEHRRQDVCDVQVYSEQIGNLMMDALSAKKYYHLVRLMGRAASHITLECALQTHPQAAIICEEVHRSNQRLSDIVREVPCFYMPGLPVLKPALPLNLSATPFEDFVRLFKCSNDSGSHGKLWFLSGGSDH